jgi:putative transposase
VDKVLYAVVMEAYTGGIPARKVDTLEVSRICQGTVVQLKPFLGRPLDHARYPYAYLDATYLDGRLGPNMQVFSQGVVVAIGINALGHREVLGMPWATARRRASAPISSAPSRSVASLGACRS